VGADEHRFKTRDAIGVDRGDASELRRRIERLTV
jgi:hypothetical protein